MFHVMNILLIDDEQRIADFVCAGFKEQGFKVEHCSEGNEGYERAVHGNHDVIVLEIMLPGRDGLSTLKGLRKSGNATPVILLKARNEQDDRVDGFNLGADDYLAKPFFVEELIARIRAMLRRIFGVWSGQSIELKGRELNQIENVMHSQGRVFTFIQILVRGWSCDFDPGTSMVRSCS